MTKKERKKIIKYINSDKKKQAKRKNNLFALLYGTGRIK